MPVLYLKLPTLILALRRWMQVVPCQCHWYPLKLSNRKAKLLPRVDLNQGENTLLIALSKQIFRPANENGRTTVYTPIPTSLCLDTPMFGHRLCVFPNHNLNPNNHNLNPKCFFFFKHRDCQDI